MFPSLMRNLTEHSFVAVGHDKPDYPFCQDPYTLKWYPRQEVRFNELKDLKHQIDIKAAKANSKKDNGASTKKQKQKNPKRSRDRRKKRKNRKNRRKKRRNDRKRKDRRRLEKQRRMKKSSNRINKMTTTKTKSPKKKSNTTPVKKPSRKPKGKEKAIGPSVNYIDRHDCVSLDVNKDGYDDIICMEGAKQWGTGK